MNFVEKLKTSAKNFNSILCMGLDPVIEKIPIKNEKIYDKIVIFYTEILNQILKKKIYPASVKPNYAFYAQYGFDGIKALKTIIQIYKAEGFDIILDVKRGDIGTTAAAYAKEAFEFFTADAVTLAPYMGYDSIKPFVDNYPEKGYYVLCKTSNKSSSDFQNLIVDNERLYLKVAEKLIAWNKNGLGAVVGATYPVELEEISKKFYVSSNKKEIPLLLPGVGSQGGDLEKIINILKNYSNINIQRINSSSGINYAYLKTQKSNFAKEAVLAIELLNNQIEDFL